MPMSHMGAFSPGEARQWSHFWLVCDPSLLVLWSYDTYASCTHLLGGLYARTPPHRQNRYGAHVGRCPARAEHAVRGKRFSAIWGAHRHPLRHGVAYLSPADNSHGSHLGRLKGAHQSVIKPRKQVCSFSFIPPCRLVDIPMLLHGTIIFLAHA